MSSNSIKRKSKRPLLTMTFLLFTILGSALALSNSTDTLASNKQEIKNLTAGGHHYGNNNGYDGYGPSYDNEYDNGYDNSHHLVDDYVCDFDASILVVTNSNKKYKESEKKTYTSEDNYGTNNNNYNNANQGYRNNEYSNNGNSYGNEGYDNNYDDSSNHAIAHRLRCSVVAIRDDKDCSTCCQLAARRDRSVAKERVIGFIVDNDQIYRKEKEKFRQKRSPVQQPGIAPPTKSPNWHTTASSIINNVNYSTKNYHGKNRPDIPYFPPYNPRCVCCAPKHHYNNYNQGYGNAGDYNNNYSNNYGNNQQQYGGYQPPFKGSYGPSQNGYNAPPPSYNNNPYGGQKYPSKGGYGQ